MRNRCVLLVGERGRGKSTLAAAILKPQPGVLVYDPHCDEVYRFIPNTARSLEELDDFSRWRREAKPETRSMIRYIPDPRENPFEVLDEFCAWVWSWRGVWVCVEEVSESCKGVSAHGLPGELRRVLNQGRHRMINQVYCGIRLPEIPTPIRDAADVTIVFFTRDNQTRDLIVQRLGRDALEEFEGLGLHEALVVFRSGEYRKISSREPTIAEMVLKDSLEDVHAETKECAEA